MFSQSISVITNQQTVPELVNDVLINSPCVTAQNITWRTGTNFGSHNGIGYFTNTNPNFPMAAGVVLSTGNVLNTVGPNSTMLNDGSAAWTGDADLEATLAAAGINMSSTNATVLEFEFTSISSHFNFDFIFASEEYGNYQCEFSDAFAFLLTNLETGVTTNLAVVPGTNLPISVVTIRDFLYNSSCPSVNADYFGRFNGGSASSSAAINLNGQTKTLTASSVLTTNTQYHIKLVIADRGDYKSDSAIFIAADSFNLGQEVLGADYLVSENNAICLGSSHVLNSALDPALYSFKWYRNGVLLSNQTSSTLIITSPGTYTVSYTKLNGNCLPINDDIIIEFYPELQFPDPQNIAKCDNGQAMQTFNLSQNTTTVTASLPSNCLITYHASLLEAKNNVNALPLNYSSAGNQVIFVRVQNSENGCVTIKSFSLVFLPPAIAYNAPNIIKCERTLTQHNAVFNLDSNKAIILGDQSSEFYSVTYYASQADATNATNPLGLTLTSAGQTIYVRVQNISDAECFSTTSFELILRPLAPVDILPNVVVCDQYILPQLIHGSYFSETLASGSAMHAGDVITETQIIYIFNFGTGDQCAAESSFEVTVIDPLKIVQPNGTYCDSYQVPEIVYGDFFTQPNGQGTPIEQGSILTTSQRIYIYYVSLAEPFCTIALDYDITIVPSPVLEVTSDIFDCTSYTLPILSSGKYFTEPAGQGSEIAAGTAISATQHIYIFAENTNPIVCSAETSFKIYIGDLQPEDVIQCKPYKLPVLPIGEYYSGPNGTGQLIAAGTVLPTSCTIYIYINENMQECATNVQFNVTINQPAVDTIANVSVCGAYTLPPLTHGSYYTATSGGGQQLFAGDLITANKTIFIYTLSINGCSNQSQFKVKINAPAKLDARSDIDICHSYTLTPLINGNYYTGPGGSGQLLAAGTVIHESQTIYMYNATNTNPSCSVESSFELFIFTVEADNLGDISACDQFVLPVLQIGNYYSNSGGPTANNTMLQAGHIITENTTIYVYTEAGDRIRCNDENIVNITINKSPVLPAIANVQTCTSYTLPTLALGNYFTQPAGQGTMLVAGDVITSSQIVYVFAETATAPNCTDETSFNVQLFKANALPDVTTCSSYTLPTLAIGKYYAQSGAVGPQIPAGTALTQSGTYYIYAKSPFASGCSDETSFTLTIVPQPTANNVPNAMTSVCDEDATNDGIFNFDLTGLASTVLGNQTGNEFSVTFHESLFDANQNQNFVLNSTKPAVFARVNNALAPNCFDVVKIGIFVKKLPEPTFTDGYICIDSDTKALLSPKVITSGLHNGTHTFIWKNESGLTVGIQANYTAVEAGTYSLTSTNTQTGCTSIRTVTLKPSEPAKITITTSADFASESYITVTAIGSGANFEYQLDNGSFQDSPIFYNVSSGLHVITVRDLNGCDDATKSVILVNYPHYFTPNGDGNHETWNITTLRGAKNAVISIMDRYGKLITKISPDGPGWDGNYIGNRLPASDYWFVVDYEIENERRAFKAHFTLKR